MRVMLMSFGDTPWSAVLAVFLAFSMGARAEDPTGYTGSYARASMDASGCLHMVFTTEGWWQSSYYGRYDGEAWGSAVTLPGSEPCFSPYTVPTVAVGPSLMPHAAYGTETGSYPNDLAYFTLASATNVNGTAWSTQTVGGDGYRRSAYDIAADEADHPHLVYLMTNYFPPYWSRIMYRKPDGSEIVIRHVQSSTYSAMSPAIACGNDTLHIAWREGGFGSGSVNVYHASGPPEGPFVTQQLTYLPSQHYAAGGVDLAVAPDGHVEVVYVVQNGTVSPAVYTGVFSVDPNGDTTVIDTLNVEVGGLAPARIAFDVAGNRYVAWALDGQGASYHVVNGDTATALPGAGPIDVCAGPSAYYVRVTGSVILYGEITSTLAQPTAVIEGMAPNPLRRGADPEIVCDGTSFDNDEGGASMVEWEWRSSIDGLLGADEDITLPAVDLSPGAHTITFAAKDDEGVWSVPDSASLVVLADTVPPPPVTAVQVVAGPGDTVVISWGPVADNLGMADYRVFRGLCAWFELDVPVGAVDAEQPPTFIDPDGLPTGTGSAFYEIVPVDLDGNAAQGNARAGAMRFSSEGRSPRR